MLAIEVKNLHKRFKKYVALNGVNMSVQKGEIYGLLGANGAGKTTLMKTMLDLLKPDEGEVRIFGTTVVGNTKHVLSGIGNIIEIPVFYENLTVEDNLKLHCDYLNVDCKNEIPEILDLMGIDNTLMKKVKELSLGMKQRLAIGRAILCKPEILVLDEPINGLDPKGIVDIREILLRLKKDQNVTILVSSHIISELEKISDRIGIMHQGKIVEELSQEKIRNGQFDLEKYFIEILR